jgi:TonB family protein
MMTKKRTSTIAGFKILIVIPVAAIIFMAISAYREIPYSSVKQIIPVIETQNLSSESRSELRAPPPPPPPPPTQSSESEEVPFVVVEEMPMFPGGDRALLNYIREYTNYPEASKAQNIQGRVIIRFCVTAKGGVSLVSVLKGVAPELDAEAVRVVKTLPTFNPGKQGGKPVPVWYMVPITFTLK